MQKDIKCKQCGTLFGKEVDNEQSDSPLLTIKNRDLYRTIRPGDNGVVFGPCRGCGITVSWPKQEA